VIRGTGLREAREPDGPIDVGNAGTLLRLLPGWLAAQEGRSFTLDGDDRSAAGRSTEWRAPAADGRGAESDERTLSATRGARCAAALHLPRATVASAQVKSCVLLAALAADGPRPSRAGAQPRPHRADAVGCRVTSTARSSRDRRKRRRARARAGRVPGDPSSAAFMGAAGVLVPGLAPLDRDVGVNWTRTGLPTHPAPDARDRARRPARTSRASCQCTSRSATSTSPTARWRGQSSRPRRCRSQSTKLPLVALLGCFAEGETVVHGAQELRGRSPIASRRGGPTALGAEIEAIEDGFAVRAAGGLRRHDRCRGDSSLAMMGAVAGLPPRGGGRSLGSRLRRFPTRGSRDLKGLCS